MFPLEKRIDEKLEKRQQELMYRQLQLPAAGLLDFSSNDYLGLARNKELAAIVQDTYSTNPVANGSGGSRLLSGNSELAEVLEKQMARFFLAESSLLFNSGYAANMGILSSLPQKGDTILYDELAHASIKDGARLSMAQRFSFQHNSSDSLSRYLSKVRGQAFVVVESVYSMDGDVAPLKELVEVCKEFDAALIVDEAHSTGVFGKGSGLICELSLQKDVFARVHTFGKAMGCHGACIAGSQRLKNFLINFSRPFIYTTALPPHAILSLQSAFHYVESHPELAVELNSRIAFFKDLKKQYLSPLLVEHVQVDSNSPIQAIVVPGNSAVRKLSEEVKAKGYDLKAVLAPTVPKGKERLRICLHIFNTEEEIEGLVKAIYQSLS